MFSYDRCYSQFAAYDMNGAYGQKKETGYRMARLYRCNCEDAVASKSNSGYNFIASCGRCWLLLCRWETFYAYMKNKLYFCKMNLF